MNKRFLLSLFLGLIMVACTDPNIIGLEVQPTSDYIVISSDTIDGLDSYNESEDSLRTDNAFILLLGEIDDDAFEGENRGSFYTQILLTENNIDLGTNPLVDSVILSYTYSGHYGLNEETPEEFTNLEVNQIFENLHEDSVYYSNSFKIIPGNIDNVEDFNLSDNLENPFLRVRLKNEFGQQILNLGNETLKDNETFLQEFNGISVLADGSSMLYLNPNGSNTYLKIYYSNDEVSLDTLSLDFALGGDAARINLFNEKSEQNIIESNSNIYIQSMAGYKSRISLGNLDDIQQELIDKVINKATITFEVDNLYSEYPPHDRLALVRINDEGNNVFLLDEPFPGDPSFGGNLVTNKYEFNITEYFYQLLNNESYTNELYLLPAGALTNANRTILHKQIKLAIYYSEL